MCVRLTSMSLTQFTDMGRNGEASQKEQIKPAGIMKDL